MDNELRISGVIVRKGIKYLTVKLDKECLKKGIKLVKPTVWLLINDIVQGLDIGDKFSLSCKIHYKLSANATQYNISYFEPYISKSDIDREYYWLIQNYDNGNGFVNEKRLQRLRDMGAFDKITQFGELRSKHKDKEIENEKKRWFGYVKEHFEKEGYIYKKGVDKLKALGAEEELAIIRIWYEQTAKK